jgi:tripartite-type tricarboxylate transporter receptor subunit TctC
VVGDKRLQDFPNVPTMAEAGFPNVGSTLWSMMYAPAATPAAIQQTPHAAVNTALKSDQVREAYGRQQISPTPTASVAESREWLRGQMDKWRTITQDVKIDTE